MDNSNSNGRAEDQTQQRPRPAESLQLIPGFEIKSRLGKGGMGAVYLGFDHELERPVAVKTILGAYVSDPDFRKRFRREGVRHAQLNHPNVLTIFGAGQSDQHLYLVMEYAAGGTLRDKLEEGPFDANSAGRLVLDVAKGLQHAHEKEPPLIHLDIKPENLLFDSERIMLSDFGIARQIVDKSKPGSVIAGDPRYWAPEQQENQPVTQTDIYSLGLLFFELMAAKRPDQRVVRSGHDRDRLIKELPKKAQVYGPLIARCLRRNPEERPSAAELASGIESTLKKSAPSWRVFALILALVVSLSFSLINEASTDFYKSVWVYFFPPDVYEVMFEISPSLARLWTDGREQAFRTVNLTEGEHNIVSIADGYIGERLLITASANSSRKPVVISLEPRPPINDAEYLVFAKGFDNESGIDAILERQWTDTTLANLARIERMVRADDPLLDEFLGQLRWLADAGDSSGHGHHGCGVPSDVPDSGRRSVQSLGGREGEAIPHRADDRPDRCREVVRRGTPGEG